MRNQLWLSQQGRKVTVVEKLDDLLIGARPIPWMNRVMLLDLLKLHKVEVMTNSSLSEVTDKGLLSSIRILAKRPSGGYGHHCRRVGIRTKNLPSAPGNLTNLYLIGDAREAKNIMNAIWDAYEVARTI